MELPDSPYLDVVDDRRNERFLVPTADADGLLFSVGVLHCERARLQLLFFHVVLFVDALLGLRVTSAVGEPYLIRCRRLVLLVAGAVLDVVEVQGALSRGVDVNTRSPANATALITAATHGYYEIVELLLAAQADVNLATSRGNTALLLAVMHNHVHVAKLLHERGADMRATNVHGQTVTMWWNPHEERREDP